MSMVGMRVLLCRSVSGCLDEVGGSLWIVGIVCPFVKVDVRSVRPRISPTGKYLAKAPATYARPERMSMAIPIATRPLSRTSA